MKKALFDLEGKVAIVTGGGSGIGRAIAEGLAEFGANVVICGRRVSKCEEVCHEISQKTGVQALPVRCDVSQKEDVKDLVTRAKDHFGRIDILVNNAGISGKEKPILELEDEEWDSVLNINLRSALLTSKAVVPHMIEQGGGKIINVASIYAFIATRNMAPYCASKGGLIQLTRAMALEWVKYNIQVNALCPGYFETPMNKEFFESEIGKNLIKKNIPMRRIGNVEELKGIAVFLSSRASSFMTGAFVVIDGGQLLW